MYSLEYVGSILTVDLVLQEDEMLRRLVAQYGTKKWAHLATIIKTKKSKQVAFLVSMSYSLMLAIEQLTTPLLSCSVEEGGRTSKMQSSRRLVFGPLRYFCIAEHLSSPVGNGNADCRETCTTTSNVILWNAGRRFVDRGPQEIWQQVDRNC